MRIGEGRQRCRHRDDSDQPAQSGEHAQHLCSVYRRSLLALQKRNELSRGQLSSPKQPAVAAASGLLEASRARSRRFRRRKQAAETCCPSRHWPADLRCDGGDDRVRRWTSSAQGPGCTGHSSAAPLRGSAAGCRGPFGGGEAQSTGRGRVGSRSSGGTLQSSTRCGSLALPPRRSFPVSTRSCAHATSAAASSAANARAGAILRQAITLLGIVEDDPERVTLAAPHPTHPMALANPIHTPAPHARPFVHGKGDCMALL